MRRINWWSGKTSVGLWAARAVIHVVDGYLSSMLGSSEFSLTLLRELLLFGIYALTYFNTRELTRSHVCGILAAIALQFHPSIAWESQRELTNSIVHRPWCWPHCSRFCGFVRIAGAHGYHSVCLADLLSFQNTMRAFSTGNVARGDFNSRNEQAHGQLAAGGGDTRQSGGGRAECILGICSSRSDAFAELQIRHLREHALVAISSNRPEKLDCRGDGARCACHRGIRGNSVAADLCRAMFEVARGEGEISMAHVSNRIWLGIVVVLFKVTEFKDRWLQPLFVATPVLIVVAVRDGLNRVRLKMLSLLAVAISCVVVVLAPGRLLLTERRGQIAVWRDSKK